MNKILISGGLLLATLLTLASCDSREDYFDSVNTAPQLQVYKGDSLLNGIYEDSIRIGYPITFKYKLKDEEALALNSTHNSLDKVTIKNGEIILLSNTEGVSKFSVSAKDGFNKIAKTDFNFVVFSNLAPVASCTVSQVSGTKEIVIDASRSYDKDARFDGKIISYEYKVNSNYIVSSTPLNKISYICGSTGQKAISLRVLDNSGTWSTEVTKYITVN